MDYIIMENGEKILLETQQKSDDSANRRHLQTVPQRTGTDAE